MTNNCHADANFVAHIAVNSEGRQSARTDKISFAIWKASLLYFTARVWGKNVDADVKGQDGHQISCSTCINTLIVLECFLNNEWAIWQGSVSFSQLPTICLRPRDQDREVCTVSLTVKNECFSGPNRDIFRRAHSEMKLWYHNNTSRSSHKIDNILGPAGVRTGIRDFWGFYHEVVTVDEEPPGIQSWTQSLPADSRLGMTRRCTC